MPLAGMRELLGRYGKASSIQSLRSHDLSPVEPSRGGMFQDRVASNLAQRWLGLALPVSVACLA